MARFKDGKALIALTAATLTTQAAGVDLDALIFGRPWDTATVVAASCAVLALGAVAAVLRRRTWQSAAWSAGIVGLAYAALCVAYIGPRLIAGDGRPLYAPLAALVLGAVIAFATPLFPLLAWSTLGLAYVFDRFESARCVVPVAALACFAICVIVFPPRGFGH